MSFLKSGLDASLARVLRRLGLKDPTRLTAEMVGQLDRQEQLELSRQIGIEIDASADAKAIAERLWLALQAALSSDAPVVHPEPSDKATEDIPWGYGQDRVTGIAVDPNRLYVYWEITDDAIAKARRTLASGGDHASLNLRVYDSSGRIFDGTNAHGYHDEPVHREDRQWFLTLGKPGSAAIVEVGLRTPEGDFARIARSGRVEFPRWGTPSTGPQEWMTVRERPEVAAAPAPGGMSAAGPPVVTGPVETSPSGGGGAPSAGAAPIPAPAPATTVAPDTYEGGERNERTERTRTSNVHTWERQRSWSGESGPQRHLVSVPGAVTERFVGGEQVLRIGDLTHVVHGPWEVVIRGIDAHEEKTVLARWETFRSWVIEEGSEVTSVVDGEPGVTPGSSEHVTAGASERRWGLGSESRLGGASETWRLGASERRLGGASEYGYLASSERMIRGASERMTGGASEQRFAGASERHLSGPASDEPTGRANERRFPMLPPEREVKP